MPTTYAHYRFGDDVRKHLGEKEKTIILKNPDIYNYGIYGHKRQMIRKHTLHICMVSYAILPLIHIVTDMSTTQRQRQG